MANYRCGSAGIPTYQNNNIRILVLARSSNNVYVHPNDNAYNRLSTKMSREECLIPSTSQTVEVKKRIQELQVALDAEKEKLIVLEQQQFNETEIYQQDFYSNIRHKENSNSDGYTAKKTKRAGRWVRARKRNAQRREKRYVTQEIYKRVYSSIKEEVPKEYKEKKKWMNQGKKNWGKPKQTKNNYNEQSI